MYAGRFLVVAPGVGAYRVSSRSFPNRQVVDRDGTLTVAPTADAEPTDNPYVSYNCVRPAGREGEPLAVVGNGSHVDPVAEKLDMGYPPRDALALSLLALDFEKDDYDTPRIAGVVGAETAHVGTVRRDALVVREVDEPTIVATYEVDDPVPSDVELDASGVTAADAARAVYDLDYEQPVCAAGVTVSAAGVETGVHNGD